MLFVELLLSHAAYTLHCESNLLNDMEFCQMYEKPQNKVHLFSELFKEF